MQEKKGDGGTEDQFRWSAEGPAADEIQTKNKRYDMQRQHSFLPQWKTKWLWVEYDESKCNVQPNLPQIFIFS